MEAGHGAARVEGAGTRRVGHLPVPSYADRQGQRRRPGRAARRPPIGAGGGGRLSRGDPGRSGRLSPPGARAHVRAVRSRATDPGRAAGGHHMVGGPGPRPGRGAGGRGPARPLRLLRSRRHSPGAPGQVPGAAAPSAGPGGGGPARLQRRDAGVGPLLAGDGHTDGRGGPSTGAGGGARSPRQPQPAALGRHRGRPAVRELPRPELGGVDLADLPTPAAPRPGGDRARRASRSGG
jgi:hypothetical protein